MNKLIMSIFLCFLSSFSLLAQPLVTQKNQNFHLGSSFISHKNTEYLGAKILFSPRKEGFSFLGGISYMQERSYEKEKKSVVQGTAGFLYRGYDSKEISQRSSILLQAFIHGNVNSGEDYGENTNGLSLDFFHPWYEERFILSFYGQGRIENQEKPTEEELFSFSTEIGIQGFMPMENKWFLGGKAYLLRGLSSYDYQGVIPYQDIPELVAVGMMARWVPNEKESIHLEANGAIFFQTAKYWHLKATWLYGNKDRTLWGAYLEYRKNETTSPEMTTLRNFWNIGILLNL